MSCQARFRCRKPSKQRTEKTSISKMAWPRLPNTKNRSLSKVQTNGLKIVSISNRKYKITREKILWFYRKVDKPNNIVSLSQLWERGSSLLSPYVFMFWCSWGYWQARQTEVLMTQRTHQIIELSEKMCRKSAWYYNMFIILMSVFMCMSGILLTALAYRPKQISENWWDWTKRFYESGEKWKWCHNLLLSDWVTELSDSETNNSFTYQIISVIETSRIAGPMLVVLSLFLHCASVGYCLVKRMRKSHNFNRDVDTSIETKSDIKDLEYDHHLLLHNHDIACFPDGSLRSVFSL